MHAANLLSLFETSEPQSESELQPDEYRLNRLRDQLSNSECTTSCIVGCGRIAEYPGGTPQTLTACFQETCMCPNKYEERLDSPYNTIEIGEAYFKMVHNYERVDYLLMEQSFMREIATVVKGNDEFLNDGPTQIDYKYLGSVKKLDN